MDDIRTMALKINKAAITGLKSSFHFFTFPISRGGKHFL